MRKRIAIVITTTRPRQFANAFISALRKASIDAFGGVPSDGITPGDLISGLPGNLSDPSGTPGNQQQYALPPRTHFVTDAFLRVGDTIFEQLTRNGSIYEPSLDVDFYRNVWFDGLAAERSDHYSLIGSAVSPNVTLSTDVRVTAKYVLA